MIKEFKPNDNFEEMTKKGVFIFDFSATWCGPCKMLHPVFEEVSNKLSEYNFISVDVDECPLLSAKFNIRAVPTLIVIVDGQVKKETAGYMDEESLEKFIQSAI